MLNLNQKLREQHLSQPSSSSFSEQPSAAASNISGGIASGFRKTVSGSKSGGNQVFPNQPSYAPKDNTNRISIRDRLLMQEVTELSGSLPGTCHVHFPSQSELCNFELIIRPESESLYSGGVYKFHVSVPLEYNNVPPKVRCLTRIWHPNIAEEGSVCLSLLRQTAIDGLGWSPTRKLKDVVWGLNSLFTDLLDFDDPLNIEAAEHYHRDQGEFQRRIREYIRRYCDTSAA